MLIQAHCYRTGVKTTDHRGHTRGFNFGRSPSTPTRSGFASPAEAMRAPFLNDDADPIRAFGDDGTLGLAVLPPGFTI